jgi:hypothetical protein
MIGSPAIFFPVGTGGERADVQAQGGSNSMALIWAAFTEAGDPKLVEELLRLTEFGNSREE